MFFQSPNFKVNSGKGKKKNRHAMLPTPLLTIACKFGGKTGESALTERFLCK